MWICVCHARRGPMPCDHCLFRGGVLSAHCCSGIWLTSGIRDCSAIFAQVGELEWHQLGDIHAKAGGMDLVRRNAEATAQLHHSVSVLKEPSLGGNPGKSGDIKDNPNTKRGCACYNLGNPHGAKSLDKQGNCLFRHACDHLIDEKNEGGSNKHCLNSAVLLATNGVNATIPKSSSSELAAGHAGVFALRVRPGGGVVFHATTVRCVCVCVCRRPLLGPDRSYEKIVHATPV